MPKDKKVTEYIEWTTIPYRTIRFWVVVILLGLIGTGIFLVSKYGLPVGGGTEDNPPETLEKRGAKFMSTDGDVRVRKMNSIEWVPADKSVTLYPGDLIKTSSNSSCQVVFFDGTVYEVKPSSLVSILESYENPSTMGRQVNVELAEGSVDMSTSQKNVPESQMKVETSNTVTNVDEHTRVSAAYDEKLHDTGIKVAQGRARITDKSSRQSVVAGSNEQVQIKDGGMTKLSLPPAPALLAPRTNETFATNEPKKQSIRLEWAVTNPRCSYRVSISTHPKFYQKIFEQVVEKRGHLVISGLDWGRYYWRVVAIDENNIEGYPSTANMFALRRGKVNPSESIRLELKEIIIMGNILEVIGKTDPDNYLTINDKVVSLSKDGSFKHFTEPFAGGNVATLNIVVKDYSGAVKQVVKKIPLD